MPAGAAARVSGSPGVLGYMVAVCVSLVALACELAVLEIVEGDAAAAPGIALLTLYFGAVPAAILGTIGVLVVDVLTAHTSRQAWHVGAAAGVGFAGMFLMVFRMDLDAALLYGMVLGSATASGRACVIPLARTRTRGSP